MNLFIEGCVRLVARVAVRYYRLFYSPFILRPNTSDLNVFISIFILGDLRLKNKLKPKLIVDAGAYTGLSALYYSFKYPDTKIVAIEPERSNFEILEKNTGKSENISRIRAGLWSSSAKLIINARETGKWGFTVKEVAESETYDVKGIDLDEILRNTGMDEIDILKIDIEGSEKEVFSKNVQGWINKVKIIVVEMHDRFKPGCREAVLNAIDVDKWNRYQNGDKEIFIRKDVDGK